MTGRTGRVRRVTCHVSAALREDWEFAATPPSAIADPSALDRALVWRSATVPTTAAAALGAAGAWSLDGPPRRFDAEDWWWRVRFSGDVAGEAAAGDEVVLCLDGIATVAEVWFNGERLLQTDNMFLEHRVPVHLRGDNELVVACRSLDALLTKKRPRPRWRAPMIENAQLRWFRTTLLGRTPGWSPAAAAVGPYRPVRIERRRGIVVEDVRLRARVDGDKGVLEVSATLRSLGANAASVVVVVLERGGRRYEAGLTPVAPAETSAARAGHRFEGRLVIQDVERWWPHTHGETALYEAHLAVAVAQAAVTAVRVDLGAVGFRELTVETSNGDFAVSVNGAPVFCRGACWTPLSVTTLRSDDDAYETALAQAAGAGMNMIRVGGTMVYETDAFLDAADRLGILLFQDLMFANMDYPEDDAAFAASVAAEVRQQLRRLEARPSVAVVCGNSEVEQQAAMFGASRDRWSPPLFHATLAELAREILPDVPYWPSSAHGGAVPHQVDVGTTSYYGVGAYLRPLSDARRAGVRLATECLAFANVPAPKTLERMPNGAGLRVHHAEWKARTPRDLGAGWDFDDVRDHYLRELFGVDPASLRYSDHGRYLALSRVVTGEVMAQTFGEWRRAGGTCRGALVWFLRDLWPGAGWGVIGADGQPKAAYHYLRRTLAPVAVHLSDEGNNGVYLHVANDRATELTGQVTVTLFRGETVVGRGQAEVAVPPRGVIARPTLQLFEGFVDVNHAFRFGPPVCDLVVASLDAHGPTAHERGDAADAFFFPLGLPSARRSDIGLTAKLTARGDGDLELRLETRAFAQSIAIELDGFAPDDAFFHLAPGSARSVRLRCTGKPLATALRASVTPLNADFTLFASVESELPKGGSR